MRRINVVLSGLLLVVLLAGCGNENTQTENEAEENQATQTSESSNEEGTEKDNTKEKENEKKTNKNLRDGADVAEVLDMVAKAMNEVNGMGITGETEYKSEIMGMEMHEVSEISGTTTMDPFAQHIVGETTSETGDIKGTSKMEMYTVDDKTYFFDPSSDGWMVMGLQIGDIAGGMTDAQFRNYSKYHELFQMTENKDSYILSFEGSGEEYEKVVHGGLKEVWGEEAYEAVIGLAEGSSGSYEYTIDKETFRVVSMTVDVSTAIAEGMNNETKTVYHYDKFNEIDEISVPEEIVNKAKSMSDLMEMEE